MVLNYNSETITSPNAKRYTSRRQLVGAGGEAYTVGYEKSNAFLQLVHITIINTFFY
jgi:hypothetical protein